MMTLNCWIRSLLIGILFLTCIPSSRGDELSVRIYKEAKGLYAAERYDEALKRFMDAYVLQPSPRLLQNVAMSHWKQGHLKEAIIFFRRFLKDPNLTAEQRASAERTLSRLQESEAQQSPKPDGVGSPDQQSAEAERKKALEISAEGKALYKSEKYAAAVEHFREAYVLHAEPKILQNLAMAYWKQGQTTEALALFIRYRDEANPIGEQRAQVDAAIEKLQQGTASSTDNVSLAEDDQPAEPAQHTDPRVNGTRPSAPTDLGQAEKVPVYKKWWFWTAVAGGAVAVGLAIALPIALTRGPKDPCAGADLCLNASAVSLRIGLGNDHLSLHP
jgi:tetratricopeptide (TPR) repeat protein